MTSKNPYNYLLSFSRNGKVIEQHFLHTIDEVRVFKAVAHSKNCETIVFQLNDDSPEPKKIIFKSSVEKRGIVSNDKCWNRWIKCVETGDIYPSIRECHRRTGIPYRSLYNAIRSGNARNGLHFIALSERNEKVRLLRDKHRITHSSGNKPFTRKIICIDTGESFSSVKDCLLKMNLSSGHFYRCLHSNKPCMGKIFQYVT